MMLLMGADASRVAASDCALAERQLQARHRYFGMIAGVEPSPQANETCGLVLDRPMPLIIPFFAKLLPMQVAFRPTPWRAAGPPSTGGSIYAADSELGARSQSLPSG